MWLRCGAHGAGRQTTKHWGAVSGGQNSFARRQRIRVNAQHFPSQEARQQFSHWSGTKTQHLRNSDFLNGLSGAADRKFSLDIATFYNVYDRLQTLEPDRPFFEIDPQPPHPIIPLRFSNMMRGETYGVETSANWTITHKWKLTGGYSFLRMQLQRYAESLAQTAEVAEGQNPRHQFQLHSFLTLPRNFEMDASLYQVSSRPTDNIPSHTRSMRDWAGEYRNVELVRRCKPLDKQHPEFSGGRRTSEPGALPMADYLAL